MSGEAQACPPASWSPASCPRPCTLVGCPPPRVPARFPAVSRVPCPGMPSPGLPALHPTEEGRYSGSGTTVRCSIGLPAARAAVDGARCGRSWRLGRPTGLPGPVPVHARSGHTTPPVSHPPLRSSPRPCHMMCDKGRTRAPDRPELAAPSPSGAPEVTNGEGTDLQDPLSGLPSPVVTHDVTDADDQGGQTPQREEHATARGGLSAPGTRRTAGDPRPGDGDGGRRGAVARCTIGRTRTISSPREPARDGHTG